LIKACAKLEGVDFRLWLAGDGPQRKSLENLVAGLDMTGHITFWGFLEDIRPMMWEADLFVLPSKTPEPSGSWPWRPWPAACPSWPLTPEAC